MGSPPNYTSFRWKEKMSEEIKELRAKLTKCEEERKQLQRYYENDLENHGF